MCQSHITEYVIIGGDFNTDFSRDDHQTAECVLFCQQEKMKSCGLMPCSSGVYTYESHTNGARTHIDHIMVSENMSEMVKECYPFTNIHNQSDHLCVISDINIKCEYFKYKKVEHVPRTAWYKRHL